MRPFNRNHEIVIKMFEFLATLLINHNLYRVDFEVNLHHDHNIENFQEVYKSTVIYSYIFDIETRINYSIMFNSFIIKRLKKCCRIVTIHICFTYFRKYSVHVCGIPNTVFEHYRYSVFEY